ncbi:MAG: RNA-binding S4 domain-containing protein [Bacilli bacterium]|nr:RNA-binding S4 domain-containing protein [Bacilli bacterium]
MRVDKYLKVSRLIKRRTVAKEVAEHERIEINNKTAKPSSEVKVGDLVTITYGNKKVTIRVTQISESSKKADAENMYEIVSEERL